MIIGCAGVAALLAIVVVAAAALLVHFGQDPEGVSLAVEGPDTVAIGQEFTITVVVNNQRADEPIHLTDIDLDDEYLRGFLVLGTEPQARSSRHIPIDETMSFTFNIDVPPKETMRFGFRLKPTSAGVFRGEADVNEGQRFLSVLMQTWVKR